MAANPTDFSLRTADEFARLHAEHMMLSCIQQAIGQVVELNQIPTYDVKGRGRVYARIAGFARQIVSWHEASQP